MPYVSETSRLGQADSVVQVWHGTHLFAVENAAANVLASSFDEEKGHGTLEDTPGVYVTPVQATTWAYAVAMKAFQDEDLADDQQRWTKIIFECRADQSQRLEHKNRGKGNVQWVYPERAIEVTAIIVATNAPPQAGERRFYEWIPELEAGPGGTHHDRIKHVDGRWIVHDPPQFGAAAKSCGKAMLPTPRFKAKKVLKCARCGIQVLAENKPMPGLLGCPDTDCGFSMPMKKPKHDVHNKTPRMDPTQPSFSPIERARRGSAPQLQVAPPAPKGPPPFANHYAAQGVPRTPAHSRSRSPVRGEKGSSSGVIRVDEPMPLWQVNCGSKWKPYWTAYDWTLQPTFDWAYQHAPGKPFPILMATAMLSASLRCHNAVTRPRLSA